MSEESIYTGIVARLIKKSTSRVDQLIDSEELLLDPDVPNKSKAWRYVLVSSVADYLGVSIDTVRDRMRKLE